jgi:hypothetical protein
MAAAGGGEALPARRWLRYGGGVLLIVLGAVWLLQGVGVLPGSFMTGQILWAVIGGACILLGGSLFLPVRR